MGTKQIGIEFYTSSMTVRRVLGQRRWSVREYGAQAYLCRVRNRCQWSRSPLRHDVIDGLVRLNERVGGRRAEATQGLANFTMHLGKPERDAAPMKCRLEVDQQFGSGEVGVGDVAHEEDNQARR